MNSDNQLEQRAERLVNDYQPSEQTRQLISQARPVFLTGISGAGKDTIKQELLKTGRFHHIVSHTTRAPRENNGIMEVDGQDYHFIDMAQAVQMLGGQEFVEAKFVHGRVYGTSVAEFKRALSLDKRPLTDIDVQGVAEYLQITDQITPIFVLPPSFEIWQQRLRQRYATETEFASEWSKRQQTAKQELTEALNNSSYYFVLNDDLLKAVDDSLTIIDGRIDSISQTEARQLIKNILAKL